MYAPYCEMEYLNNSKVLQSFTKDTFFLTAAFKQAGKHHNQKIPVTFTCIYSFLKINLQYNRTKLVVITCYTLIKHMQSNTTAQR